MDYSELLKRCDHTLLRQDATRKEIREICDDGIKYSVASVCIPPAYVKMAREYVEDKLKICTVIGFPNGYSTTAVKCFEAEDAIYNGADEIDMVINISWAKAGEFDRIEDEVAQVKKFCGDKILKVIIETCYLTTEEKYSLCDCVTAGGTDYIKTSTGFGDGGAMVEDVILMKKSIGSNVKIKAAGGIRTAEDINQFLSLGCDRIGSSRAVEALCSDGEV